MEGLGVFIGVCLTLGIGAAFLVVALVAALVQHARTPGERLRPRIVRFVAGPLACLGVGAISTVAFAFGGALDDAWFLLPFSGVAAGAAVSASIALKRRRMRERWARALR